MLFPKICDKKLTIFCSEKKKHFSFDKKVVRFWGYNRQPRERSKPVIFWKQILKKRTSLAAQNICIIGTKIGFSGQTKKSAHLRVFQETK
jgi:hypothetical protein